MTRVDQVLNDLERIGDYAEILVDLTEKCVDQSLVYSEQAHGELMEIYQKDLELYETAVSDFLKQHTEVTQVEELYQHYRSISRLAKQSQANHMDRMRRGECQPTPGLLFVEVLNSLARVGGHSINVAQSSVAE